MTPAKRLCTWSTPSGMIVSGAGMYLVSIQEMSGYLIGRKEVLRAAKYSIVHEYATTTSSNISRE
jgi:hypothetical protein